MQDDEALEVTSDFPNDFPNDFSNDFPNFKGFKPSPFSLEQNPRQAFQNPVFLGLDCFVILVLSGMSQECEGFFYTNLKARGNC